MHASVLLRTCVIVSLLLTCGRVQAQAPKLVATGEASIRGRVIERVTEKPLADVTITLTNPERDERTTVTTAADGRYVLDKIADGDYRLVAAHPDFVPQVYGGGSPGIPSQFVSLGPRDRLVNMDFVLTRGAQIRGRITDEAGKPIEQAQVQAMGWRGMVTTQIFRMATTDKNGEYRLDGIVEGEYIVRAQATAMRGGIKNNRTAFDDDFDPAYFPGVSATEHASVIRLTPGDIKTNVNIELRQVHYVDLNGQVVSSGSLPDGLELTLTAVANGAQQRQGRTALREDGAFTFERLKPGRYILWARATTADGVEIAHLPVDLDGTIAGVRLELTPASTVSGRVVTERGQPLPPHGFRIAAVLMDQNHDVDPRQFDQVEVAIDGRFTLAGLFGDRVLRVFGLPSDWQVIRVESGRAPIERLTVSPGIDIGDLVVVLGRR